MQLPHTIINLYVLTDVEILSAWPEFKSKGKGSEELEFFRELQRSIWRVRPVTFPSLEAFGSVVAGTVAVKVHHVEDIAFSLIFWDRVLIVRAENVQVVIDTDVYVVITPLESVRNRRKGKFIQGK